jgi:hypothetical protein
MQVIGDANTLYLSCISCRLMHPLFRQNLDTALVTSDAKSGHTCKKITHPIIGSSSSFQGAECLLGWGPRVEQTLDLNPKKLLKSSAGP